MSIISYKGYEDGKDSIGRKMHKLIEKELDRAKKRRSEKQRLHLERFEHKCEMCGDKLKMSDSPILLEKGLLCQECFKPISGYFYRPDLLRKGIKYIEEYEKR